MFQLYIALQRKTKNKLTGVAMETMRASAPVNLERIESGLYQQVRNPSFNFSPGLRVVVIQDITATLLNPYSSQHSLH